MEHQIENIDEILNNIYTHQVMDSSGKQFTNIQEQPDNEQELDLTMPNPSTKRGMLSFNISSFWGKCRALISHIDQDAIVRYILTPATVLLIVGGSLYWKFYINGMNTKHLSVGGYDYSFTFLRPAKYGQYSNGMRGYAVSADQTAVIGPVSGLSELCGLNGDPYKVAFIANVNGATRPVCTSQDSQDEQIYMVTFTAQNAYHELMITYGYSQNVKDYPKLKSIIESVKVSR